MSYVVSRHGSDLLVAAQAADERAISHALKQIDDRLFLDIDHDETHECLVYKVRYRLGDRPPMFVLAWTDDYGRPLPLSHALVDLVKRQRDSDSFRVAQEHNRRLKERAAQELADEVTAIHEDIVPRIHGRKSSPLHRGQHLRRSRHKPGGRWQR